MSSSSYSDSRIRALSLGMFASSRPLMLQEIEGRASITANRWIPRSSRLPRSIDGLLLDASKTSGVSLRSRVDTLSVRSSWDSIVSG